MAFFSFNVGLDLRPSTGNPFSGELNFRENCYTKYNSKFCNVKINFTIFARRPFKFAAAYVCAGLAGQFLTRPYR